MSYAGDAPIRASDAERDATVEQLRVAAGEGRLTLEELADRIESASLAKSRGELERVTSDLPVNTLPAPTPGPPGGAPRSVPAGTAPATTTQSTVFGDINRKGAWSLPVKSAWSSFFGDVTLDVREAAVPAGEVTIEVRSVFGDIDLLVPEGVAVELRVKTMLGDVSQKGEEPAFPGAPRIVVTGSTVFGDVKVRSKRLRERLADGAARWLSGSQDG